MKIQNRSDSQYKGETCSEERRQERPEEGLYNIFNGYIIKNIEA